MLKGTVIVDVFYLRIGNAAVIFEKGWQATTRDIATLVDRRGQYGTSELPKPNRIVGSSTEK